MAKKKSDFIDIKAILREYASKWYWFVISIAVCGALGFVYGKIKKPVYAVYANVIISQDDKGGMGALGSLGDLFGSKNKVDDEIFVISSHSVYRNVASDLGINKKHYVKGGFLRTKFAYPEFPVDVIFTPGIADTLRKSLVFKININKKGFAEIKAKAGKEEIADVSDAKLPATLNTDYGVFIVDTTGTYVPGKQLKSIVTISGYDLAAEALSKQVAASIASKRSNAIRLGIKTINPDYGKDVLNQVIERYNLRGIAEKNLQAQKTAKFIDDRLAIITGDLNEAESTIQQYKEERGIVDVRAEAQYQTGKQHSYEAALVNAETQAEVVKMTGEFISDPANAYALIPMTVENKSLQDGIKLYNETVLKRMEIAATAKPGNRALAQIDAQIDAMRENITTSVKRTYDNLQVGIRDMRRQVNSASGQLGNVPRQEREFLNMKRQQEVKQQLYLFLLEKREETAMMLANAVPKGLIVDEAFTLTKPVSMSKTMILLIALFIGLCLPPFVLYLRKVLRTKFDTKDEVEDVIDVPIIGEICQDRTGNSLVVSATDTSSTTELFRLMRSNLLFVLGDRNEKVIMITSTTSGEGKSFVSINLAATLSLLDKKVLIIGMDIRKPRLAEYFDIHPRFGLTQYLASDQITLDSLIVNDPRIPSLDIITAGPIPPNPAELLTSKKLDAMMAELRERYDYIIIDSAPVGMVSDTFTLDRLADATVYVVRANYTSRSDLRFIEEIYRDHRLKKLTVAVNGTATRRGYGYGYGEKKKS